MGKVGNNWEDLVDYGLESVGTVTYEFANKNNQDNKLFDLADGVLTIKKEYQNVGSIDRKTQVQATYKFTAFPEKKLAVETYTIVQIDKFIEKILFNVNNGAAFASSWVFDQANAEGDYTYTIKALDLINKIGTMTPGEFDTFIKGDKEVTEVTYKDDSSIKVAFFEVQDNGDVKLTIKKNRNMAHVAEGKNVVTATWKKGELYEFTLTANIATTTTFPEHKVEVNGGLVSAENTTNIEVSQIKDTKGKISAIAFKSLDIHSLFNYAEKSEEVTKANGKYDVVGKIEKKKDQVGETGVSIDNNGVITIEKDRFDGKVFDKITATGTIDYDNFANYDKDNSQKVVTISVTNLSGKWTMSNNAFSFSKKDEKLNIAKGCTWTDYLNNIMWQDGVTVQGEEDEDGNNPTAYAKGIKGLEVYGLSAPVFEIDPEDPNGDKFDVTPNGIITWKGGDFELQQEIKVNVIVKVKSRWSKDGEVGGDTNRTITVTFPKGLK